MFSEANQSDFMMCQLNQSAQTTYTYHSIKRYVCPYVNIIELTTILR